MSAAPADRIGGPVDVHQTVPLRGSVHRLAQPRFDRGAVAPAFAMNHMMLFVRPSAAQQAELDRLLAEQQNPSSPQFHKWLAPEEFGNRFGLTPHDHSQIVAWLNGEGFTVEEAARARNWIMFSGTAEQVERALHTSIHSFEVNGEKHFANVADPAIPSKLAGIVAGFGGLHDFQPEPLIRNPVPEYNSGSSHYLIPADYGTIYDINPVWAAGIDGTGVNIGIVGTSTLILTDIQAFRSKYGIPARDPKTVLAGTNPGLVIGALEEADLDIQWAGAVAPGAQIYYYYSASLTTAISSAVNANLVHMLSISYGGAEMDNSALALQPIFQQANAQGITVFASSGDSGAAQFPDASSFARFGPAVSWPASYPEVTALGGTQFNDSTNASTYWSASNNADLSSALSYIPELAWLGGGGGPSAVFAKPAWQAGPGVPQDNARDLPDLSLAASPHDGFVIIFEGVQLNGIGGTSASSPCMAGITALLIQSLAGGGSTVQGLGNMNPQLYRLAQSAPNGFHDVTAGSNVVTCTQGTPGCSAGTFGYQAAPGYDMATGLGSLDVNNFIGQWNSATNAVNVTFTVSPSSGTFNDTFQLTATVAAASGSGTPGGMVDFSLSGTPLASVPLGSGGTAAYTLPGYRLGSTGAIALVAEYRGDTAFSGGGATASVQVSAPSGVASIVPSAPVSVTAIADPGGLFWQFNITLRERAGTAALVTGVNVDGQDQPLADYFPDAIVLPNATLNSRTITYRNLAYPLVRKFVISGIDATGQAWSRELSITFLGVRTSVTSVILTAAPLIMAQDPSAPANCQWSQRVVLTETSGYSETVTGFWLGNVSLTDRIPEIFGSSLLAPYGMLEGTVCWAGASPGNTDTVTLAFSAGFTQDMAVSFAGPAANSGQTRVAPANITMSSTDGKAPVTASLVISAPDGQPWTVGFSPQNLVSGWLSVSQASGTGSAQITVQASGAGLSAGAYHADLVIQGAGLQPAVATVPVMFVVGDPSAISIAGIANAASGQSVAAPGMLAVITGTGLATQSVRYGGNLYVVGRLGSVLVTVNGLAAPVHSVSPTQIAFQIPYEIGNGPAVVGVSHDNAAAGSLISVTPSAPGIFADSSGSVTPSGTVQAGSTAAITMTGDGITSPVLPDGASPGTSTLSFKTALPFTLTIGGAPAFLTSYGIAQGMQGVTTLNVLIPANAPTGQQPVVITVNGVASPPANLTITPPAAH